MAKFTITINTDNAAFEDDLGAELSRVLREVAFEVERGMCAKHFFSKPVRDINGNTVGKYNFTK